MLDPTLKKQVINWVICDEFVRGRGYAERAWRRLHAYGLDVLPSYVSVIKQKIASGEHLPSFPTNFSSGLRSRYHKDVMYGEFWRLMDVVLREEPVYIGLPAYNVECVRRRVGDNVSMVERDQRVIDWTTTFYQKLMKREHPGYIKADIWDHLCKRSVHGQGQLFNVFDLDLMMGITPDVNIDLWARFIYWNSKPTAVASIVTTIGRINSYQIYQKIMPALLISSFKEAGFKHVRVYSGQYQDNKHPMMYEHFHLEK